MLPYSYLVPDVVVNTRRCFDCYSELMLELHSRLRKQLVRTVTDFHNFTSEKQVPNLHMLPKQGCKGWKHSLPTADKQKRTPCKTGEVHSQNQHHPIKTIKGNL